MDQTDQAIERSKMVTSLTIHPCPVCHGKIYKTFLQVVAQTVETGAQTAATLTQQVCLYLILEY